MNIKKCVDLQTIELNKYINATPKFFGIVFWVERLIYIKYRGKFQVFFSKGPFKYYSSMFLAFFHPTHPPCNFTKAFALTQSEYYVRFSETHPPRRIFFDRELEQYQTLIFN